MVALTKRRMRSKSPVLEQALTGTVRDHHRRLLTMQLRHIDFLDAQIAPLNSAIEVSFICSPAMSPTENWERTILTSGSSITPWTG
jgi:hypothetical protein